MDFQMDEKSRRNYLGRRYADIEVLTAAFLNRNFRVLEIAGHQIKGSARSYGFDSLTGVATKLEDSAREKDEEGTMAALREFENTVKLLRI